MDCAAWDENKLIGNIKSIAFNSDFDIKEYLDSLTSDHYKRNLLIIET